MPRGTKRDEQEVLGLVANGLSDLGNGQTEIRFHNRGVAVVGRGREYTRWDALRAELGELASRAGAGLRGFLNRGSSHHSRPQPQPQSTLNYGQMMTDERAAVDKKTSDLRQLKSTLVNYIAQLDLRIAQKKPYNFFGAFLKNVLRYSDEKLRARGTFTAAEKKPQAERLLRAVEYAIDGTIRRSADIPLNVYGTPESTLSRAILNSGRLGGLTARLDVYYGSSAYDEMRSHKGNTHETLRRLEELSIEHDLLNLTAAIVWLEQLSRGSTIDVRAIGEASHQIARISGTILDVIPAANALRDQIIQHSNSSNHRTDEDIIAAETKLTSLGALVSTTMQAIEARKLAANKAIAERSASVSAPSYHYQNTPPASTAPAVHFGFFGGAPMVDTVMRKLHLKAGAPTEVSAAAPELDATYSSPDVTL